MRCVPSTLLTEALEGADVFLGLSAAGAMTTEMVKKMANRPIIFAMANPVPEIMPDAVKSVRPDAIIATGRSDFPNQVNNVLGFPISSAAPSMRASKINEEMKIAAANAIALLAARMFPSRWLTPMANRRCNMVRITLYRHLLIRA